MSKDNGTVQHLTLGTLSSVHIDAQNIVRLTEIDTNATYSQTARRLQVIAKSAELLKEFHETLERLSEQNRLMGQTALIHPADHPLVVRQEWKAKERP